MVHQPTKEKQSWYVQIRAQLLGRDAVGIVESLDAYLAQAESRARALLELEQQVFNPALYTLDQRMCLTGNVAVAAGQRWLAQRHAQEQAFDQGLAYQAGLDGVYRLDQAVRERVAREAKAYGAQPKPVAAATSEYLTQPEAACYLKISKPTLLKLRREGTLAAFEAAGKKILYRKADLDAYLMSKRVEG